MLLTCNIDDGYFRGLLSSEKREDVSSIAIGMVIKIEALSAGLVSGAARKINLCI